MLTKRNVKCDLLCNLEELVPDMSCNCTFTLLYDNTFFKGKTYLQQQKTITSCLCDNFLFLFFYSYYTNARTIMLFLRALK